MMTTKTYEELLDELDSYNVRTKGATDTYEASLGTIQNGANQSAASAAAALVSETNAANSAASIDEDNLIFVYDDVAEYQASTKVWGVGKIIKLKDRDAEFEIIAGVGGDGYGTISNATTNQSALYNDLVATAKGFGATSNPAIATASTQAALDFGRTEVQVNEDYTVTTGARNSACISVPSNRNFSGKGTLKIEDAATSEFIVTCDESAENIEVSDLTADGSRATRVASTFGMTGNKGCSYVKFINATVKICSGRSFITNGSLTETTASATNVYFLGCHAINGGDKCFQVRYTVGGGAYMCDSDSNPDAANGSSSHYEASNSSKVVLSNSTGTMSGTEQNTIGTRVVNGCTGVAISNIVADCSRQQLFISKAIGVTVNGCTYTNGIAGAFITIADDGGVAFDIKNVAISNCNFLNVIGQDGVRVNTDAGITNVIEDVSFRGCTITGTFSSGINITPLGVANIGLKESNNTITGNTSARISGANPPDADATYTTESVNSGNNALNDDTAMQITLPITGASGKITIGEQGSTDLFGEFVYKSELGLEGWHEITNIGSRIETSTVPLNGTTGSDAFFNLSVSDGVLYIENRRGSNVNLTFLLTCAA